VKNKNKWEHHVYRYANNVPLIEGENALKVNWCEVTITNPKGKQIHHNAFITDFKITAKNVAGIVAAGRARWKIENETFNTLKNQGYNLGHNYGLGEKHLAVVFTMLMMLAFLVDQTQQLCCALFQSVWKKLGSKKALWESIRSYFKSFLFESMAMLYKALLYGIKLQAPIILYDTS